MRGTRTILAILLSCALFVQGVAASTMRACHMGSIAVEQSIPQPSRQHQQDESNSGAEMAAMSMDADHHAPGTVSTHHHENSGKSKSSNLKSCAWCAACCMSLALPVSLVTSPELFPGARTVFPPLAVAPPSRLPGGWERPPRA
ncbi:MAG: hypothetical protein ABIZ64_02505 [Casimicrobium sp.]